VISPLHLDQLVFGAFAALLVWAALTDARGYFIPNKLPLAIAALAPTYWLSHSVSAFPALAVGAAVFGLGLILFARGLLGGGDVKLMSAVALWAGPALVLPFLFATAIMGGVLSLAMLPIFKWRGGSATLAQTSVPYGIAISAGGLFVAARLFGGA
jgi:prepilin peptidase CpaA